jgi:hypothetical protein
MLFDMRFGIKLFVFQNKVFTGRPNPFCRSNVGIISIFLFTTFFPLICFYLFYFPFAV